ncbi:hypothetical protein [Chamaesiphon sp. OTE_20_metabat_361]|uniref:hypothetical protein n=1 Tax=Chamaesiphon sp. OTE_20_metabat_361 TaxID=2964689 RepID=UPI00286B73E7|nr:hypothetical protein [Chamaesiphon sp. OTE_20_metabat_361]
MPSTKVAANVAKSACADYKFSPRRRTLHSVRGASAFAERRFITAGLSAAVSKNNWLEWLLY